jgi:hypothetical protein
MLFVLLGLMCVGLSAFMNGASDSSAPNPILGDILIVAAQVLCEINGCDNYIGAVVTSDQWL